MKEKLRKAFGLYAYFFKIGWFTFGGGWSIVAQMQTDFVEKEKVIEDQELLDIVSVGRSLPGTMIGNVAYLFGYHQGGVLCGVMSVLGIITPPLVMLSKGIEYMLNEDTANSVKLITCSASERICRCAFDYAAKNGRQKVTRVHKANIMKLTDGLFLESFRKVAAEYPAIQADDCIVDALCMKLVQDPCRGRPRGRKCKFLHRQSGRLDRCRTPDPGRWMPDQLL